jgi:hypothetical protein
MVMVMVRTIVGLWPPASWARTLKVRLVPGLLLVVLVKPTERSAAW